jgi:hypothetical protein
LSPCGSADAPDFVVVGVVAEAEAVMHMSIYYMPIAAVDHVLSQCSFELKNRRSYTDFVYHGVPLAKLMQNFVIETLDFFRWIFWQWIFFGSF